MATRMHRTKIEQTDSLISPYIRLTPVAELTGADFGLPPEAGVVAASGGNHGAAIAYAAMRLGVKARIFVPTVSTAVDFAR